MCISLFQVFYHTSQRGKRPAMLFLMEFSCWSCMWLREFLMFKNDYISLNNILLHVIMPAMSTKLRFHWLMFLYINCCHLGGCDTFHLELPCLSLVFWYITMLNISKYKRCSKNDQKTLWRCLTHLVVLFIYCKRYRYSGVLRRKNDTITDISGINLKQLNLMCYKINSHFQLLEV